MYETTYHRPSSVDEAVALFGKGSESKYLAGGHTLIPVMKQRLASPSDVIDLARIKELIGVEASADTLTIKAATTHFDVAQSAAAQKAIPAVAYLASLIGDPAVRHRGTIGGSLAHGDPASDLPAVVLALDAEIDIAGRDGVRTVAARDFFRGVFETAAGPHELVTEVRVPKLTGDHVWSYLKFRRRAQDWATVGVAAVARRSNGGVAEPAISLVSMGATPLRAGASEAAWAAGSDPGAAAGEGTDPPSDTNGSAEYRSHLVQVLVRRAVEEASAR